MTRAFLQTDADGWSDDIPDRIEDDLPGFLDDVTFPGIADVVGHAPRREEET